MGDKMNIVLLNNIEYEIIKDYKEGYSKDDVELKLTDYFDNYDYILGDWSYGKLRLKGFCLKENKYFNEINDCNKVEEYIKNNCAYDCKYFILKRINNG